MPSTEQSILPYSKVWYKQLASKITGVCDLNVVRTKPGHVDLFVALDLEAEEKVVCERLIRSMEAEKGLTFNCRAILLKPVRIINLNGVKGVQHESPKGLTHVDNL